MDQGMTKQSLDPHGINIESAFKPLQGRQAWMSVTSFLIGSNLLVACAMIVAGAGLWHSSNAIQMAWGANFGPATKDGEWWRLGTAIFLHFGALHLAMNMLALWDSGRLVERIFGPTRFAAIYFTSGLAGNLLSLIALGDRAVSGGASGAIFGLYGALISYLIHERRRLHSREFKWMFWGAAGFSGGTLLFGYLVPGIDNAAHLGGFATGAIAGFVLLKPLIPGDTSRRGLQLAVFAVFVLLVAALVAIIPDPIYRWSEEKTARGEIREFLGEDARINARLQMILREGQADGVSFDQLAGRIDSEVAHSYEQSFEQLSALHVSPEVPSATTLEKLKHYAIVRRDASHELAEVFREGDPRRVQEVLDTSRRAAQRRKQASAEKELIEP
jgi:rhomboid protease GluP